MKRFVAKSELSDGQRRKSARSLDFSLHRGVDFASSSATCEGDKQDCPSYNVKDVLRNKLLEKKTSNSTEGTAKAID